MRKERVPSSYAREKLTKGERRNGRRKCRTFLARLGIDPNDSYYAYMMAEEPVFMGDFLELLYIKKRGAVTTSPSPPPPSSSPPPPSSSPPSTSSVPDLLSAAMCEAGIYSSTDSGIVTDADEDPLGMLATFDEWLEENV